MKEFYRYQSEYLGHGACDPKCVVAGKHYRFSVLTSHLLRMEYSEDGVFEDRPSQVVLNRCFDLPDFHVRESDDRLEISTEAFHLVYNKKEFSPENLYIEAKNRYTNYGARWKYGAKAYGNPPRHHNLLGTTRTLDKVDGEIALEHGLQDTSGRTFFDDSESLLFTEEGWLTERRAGNSDAYFLCYHHDYFAAIADFYRLTGAPPMLPRYAFGNWWSRYWKYTEESYSELLEEFKQKGFPLTVAMLDMDWHVTEVDPKYGKGWTGYTWNREYFPDPARFLAYLHENGMHCGLNLHPADGVPACEEYYPAIAKELGVDTSLEDPVNFDFADPAFVKAYFKHLMRPSEDMGADFWWIDWQQGTESAMKNLDPLWGLNHFHFLDNCKEDRRGMILSRYAGLGSHRYPLGFSGDTVATWESLTFQPYFTANATNVGYNCWSHDIGGFTRGLRDRELFTRWIQLGIFSPTMRLHSSSNPFCTKEPWGYGKETEENVRFLMRLRHRMIPYLYTGNYLAHHDLRPMITPLYYYHSEEDDAYENRNQYYFGSELMVCPITEHTASETEMASVRAWLPKGNWIDAFDGRVYRGGRVLKVNRPIERPAVFAKAGGIVPMARDAEGDNSVQNPAFMDLYVFGGADGAYTLYEDTGDGYSYRDGKYAQTRFTFAWGERCELCIRAEGDLSVLPQTRTYRVLLRGVSPCKATGEGIALQRYTKEDHTLCIELEGGDPSRELRVWIEGAALATNDDYKARVRAFLVKAPMPIELKKQIAKVYDTAVCREDVALMLNTVKLSDAIASVLAELTFA